MADQFKIYVDPKGNYRQVPSGKEDKFLQKYQGSREASTQEVAEFYINSRNNSTPTSRESNIQTPTDTQVEKNPVQQPNNTMTSGFTKFQDGTSGFIPAMKMPEIKIEEPKFDISSKGTGKNTGSLQPFGKGKPLTESIGDVMSDMPVSPEAHFDSAQSVYKQNQNWIKEVQNDPSMSPEVKQALIDDYNKNIRISNNTIDDKDLPLYAKKWLEENKVERQISTYGPSMMGGGVSHNTIRENTPEQIAFIKDLVANTPQGQDLLKRQKDYVEHLENSISEVENQLPSLRDKYWKEMGELKKTHPYSTGQTNGKYETDEARKDYIEKSNEITKRMSSLDLAEKSVEEQKKLLAAVRDGDLNILSQFGKQVGRDFWGMSEDIGTLGIAPLIQSASEWDKVEGLKDRMSKGELTEEDKLAMSAMSNNQAYQELMSDRRTIPQEVASAMTQSAPFMVNFATTGGIGKAATSGAKRLLQEGIKRNAVNAIKQGAKVGTEKLAARLAGFGVNVADAIGRSSVMAAISPHTYRDMFDNMTGQVTYGYDEEGKPYYLGNVEQMDIANALLNAWGSNTIENVSEFSGFGMEKGQAALSSLLKQRVPEIAKVLSFGSTRNEFFQGVNKAMQKVGFNGTVNEFLEEQVSTILHSFFEDGQAQWSDLVDPRQQFITYLTVAAIGSGSAIMNTGGNQLAKYGAKKAYNNAFQDFGTVFYNSQDSDIAGQFADTVRNGTIEEKQSSLADIVNSDLFNDKQKLAALNLYRAGLTYESYEGTKEAQIEEATQEIPTVIEENANPQMNAIISATVAGHDNPMQIVGGNIIQREDGSIDREQSDKQIFYIDADGNRQVTSVDFIESIEENIPTQDAIAQLTQQVAAPIIAQQENEEVRPYGIGEAVRVNMDGATTLLGQIIGQSEDGSYILQEITTGQQIPVQPRQIINEDNLQGVENGSPVIYTNQNGEQVQDVVATSPDLYAQGLIAFENGDVVPIESVIGLAQNSDTVIPVSEQNQTVTDGELPPAPTDMMIGENGAVLYNSNMSNSQMVGISEAKNGQNDITTPGEQNILSDIESIIANAPKQKNGKVDYNALMETDPNAFAQVWENRSGAEATQAQLQKVSDNIASQIASQQNKLNRETDFNKIADIEDSISELQTRKDGIDTVINNRYVQSTNEGNITSSPSESETTALESEVNLPQTENRENEHLWQIAENSNDAIELSDAYNEAMQSAGEEALQDWQKQLLGRKINRASFEMFGDRNYINGTIARSWFNQKNAESTNSSIDVIAQELGVSEQDIINFILDHPSNRIKKGNELTSALNEKFKQVGYDITGREIGGIESNSGKQLISTLEYAANNVPTQTEIQFSQNEIVSNVPNAVSFFRNDYMRLDDINDFDQFRNVVEEADSQGYFIFPLEAKDKETILNYINNAEQQSNAIQGIGENVSGESIIENVEQPTIQEQIAQTETERFTIIKTENGNYQVIDTETNQPKSRAYASRKSAEKQQQSLYEALSQANKSIAELEAYPYFSEESNDQAERALSVLEGLDPSNITLQDANKIVNIISNKDVPFYQVVQALDTKSIMIGNQDYYTPDYLKKYILYSTKDIPAPGSLAEKIVQAEAETNTNPTEAQKEAGNYKKGKVSIQGLDISIEQPRGSVRSGTDQNGKKWSIEMQNTYGYIGKTKSKDGDHIDVFLGKNPENPVVFVVDQVNQDGSFDEHKVMLGFDSIEEAREAYLSNYEEGWQGLGNITHTDMDTFKKWAKSDTRKIKPFAEYKEIQDTTPAQKEMLSEVKKRNKDGKFVVELDRRMSKTPLVLMARRVLQYNGKWRKESNSIEFDNETDAKAFRENERSLGDGTHYQSSTNIFKPVNEQTFNSLVDRLRQTGLARDVVTDKAAFNAKLDEVVNDNATAKQVLSEMESIKQEAIDNGTFMLASNGKQTNLTENQWLQVRTQSFIDWFGDWINNPDESSKMVDINGEPQIFYHRTPNEFTVFDASKNGENTDAGWLGDGFYFYGEKSESYGYGDKSIEAFLNIREPYYATDQENLELAEKNDREASVEFSNNIKSEGYDGVYYNGDFRQETVAFEPTQIKSAISNTGAFDSNNPDIRMQVLESSDILKTKEKQLATVLSYNPAPNDYNTWVRSVEDIQTAQEAFKETLDTNDSMYPDFTADDMQKALDDGEITMYSSKPIKKGVFITPSRMNAEEYAGGGKVYSKTIKLTDVAWIDESEGQYTPIRMMRTNTGNVYGFVTPDGTVYLDSTRMNANTPVHEFGHLWVDFIQQQNPDLFQTGENLILNSAYWDKVQNDPYYSTLTQEQQINEALAMAIGDKGASVVNDKRIGQKLIDWIQSVWEWIGSKIGIRDLNASQLQELTLSQFTELAVADLLGGKDIANIPAAPESLNGTRFQSVGDVADATNSTMTEEMRKELDRKTSRLRYRIREGWEDKHLAVKEFQDILRKNGVDIAEYNDYHKQATHIAGKNDAQLERYNEQFQKPLNEAIADFENDGWEHRDIENYAILKHGLERNAWMRQDAIDKYMAANPNATQDQIDKFTDSLPDDYSGVISVEEETKQTAQEFIDEFESETSKNLIDNFWKRINDATSFSLKKQLDGGFINKKFFDELTSRYDYYIPLRGHDVEVAEDRWDYTPDEGTYFVNPVMKANGRRSRAEKPFAYIASAAQSAINSANRNTLNQIWKRLAAKDKTGLLSVSKAWYVQNGNTVDGKPEYEIQEPTYSENPGQYRKNIDEFEERMQKLAEQGLATNRTGKLDIGGLFIKNKQKEQHAIPIYQNGTEYTVYINANPKVAQAINGTNVVDPGKFFQSIANGSRFLATNFTTRNPAFVVSNFARDYIFASSILPVKEGAKYTLEFKKNLIKADAAMSAYIMGKADLTRQADRYLNEYIMNGAKTGFSHIIELQKVQKQIERDIEKSKGKGVLDYTVRPVIEALSAANDFAENLSRLSVYITSREEGRSIIQSVSDAKEVTVNFNKSGTGAMGAAYVRSLFLFTNVVVQALSNIMRVGKNNKGKMSALLSTYMLSGAMIAPMLASLIGGDDGLEEYFNLNDWERKNNFCIYTGKGFIKIPLPQELRVFHSMGDNFAQWFRGDKDATEALLDTSLGLSDLLPTNPLGTATASLSDFQKKGLKGATSTAASLLSPDIAKPFTQLIANRSFTGSRIVNEWANENDPGYKQVRTNKKGDPYAPDFLVDMAESLDNITGGDGVQKGGVSLNPDVINHLMRGYFGGLYTMSTDVISMGAKGIDKATGGDPTIKTREIPIFKNFYTSSDDIQNMNNSMRNKYYNMTDEVKKANHDYKGYAEQYQGNIDAFIKVMNENPNMAQLAALNKMVNKISRAESQLKNLSGDEQKKAEDNIKETKEKILEMYDNIKTASK